jgi:hypothetical protein
MPVCFAVTINNQPGWEDGRMRGAVAVFLEKAKFCPTGLFVFGLWGAVSSTKYLSAAIAPGRELAFAPVVAVQVGWAAGRLVPAFCGTLL